MARGNGRAPIAAQHETLEASRAAEIRRRNEIVKRIEAVDLRAADQVKGIPALQRELADVSAVIDRIELSMREVQAPMAIEAANLRLDQAAALDPDEDRALADVIRLARELMPAIEGLVDIQRRKAGLGGMLRSPVPSMFVIGLRAALDYWRLTTPELLGLPARLSHLEEQQANAIADVERQLTCFADIEKLLAGPIARASGKDRHALETRRGWIIDNYMALATRCRELGCKAPQSGGMTVARMSRATAALIAVDGERRQRERYGTDAPDEPEAAES